MNTQQKRTLEYIRKQQDFDIIAIRGLCDCGHPNFEHEGKSHKGKCTVYTDHECPCPSYYSSWIAYGDYEE